jgi:hypothetical protein
MADHGFFAAGGMDAATMTGIIHIPPGRAVFSGAGELDYNSLRLRSMVACKEKQ